MLNGESSTGMISHSLNFVSEIYVFSTFHALCDCGRDLKPENVLCVSKADDINVKLTDFGLAKSIAVEECKTFCECHDIESIACKYFSSLSNIVNPHLTFFPSGGTPQYFAVS